MASPQSEKQIDGQKVAIYIRWSTDDQTDGTTLEVQLEGCRHYVLSQGWRATDHLTFIDDGFSGGNLDRPALNRLRKLIKVGQVDCVVVMKVDRLSRSVVDTVNLVLQEWDGRTYLKSAREPIDTTSAMGKQFFYMLVSYAEWERSVIRERTVSGKRRRAHEGYKPSAIAPYGYRHSPGIKGALEPIPLEADIVQRIFTLSVEGKGAKAISNVLNSEGVPYRDRGLWGAQTISYMLRNRLYSGATVYGKTTRNPRYGKKDGERLLIEGAQIVVESSSFVPAIINEELFHSARAAVKRRLPSRGEVSGRSNVSAYLLTGVGKCKCGYALYASYQNSKNCPYVYTCLGKRMRGALKCDAMPIPMVDLNAEIERRLKHEFGQGMAKETYVEQVLHRHSQEQHLIVSSLGEIDRQLADLDVQAQKVRRDYRSDRLTAEEYRDLRAEIEQEVQTLQGHRSSMANQQQKLEVDQADIKLMSETFVRIDRWDTLSMVEKKSVLRFFVHRLTAYRPPDSKDVDINLVWFTPGDLPSGTESLKHRTSG